MVYFHLFRLFDDYSKKYTHVKKDRRFLGTKLCNFYVCGTCEFLSY